MSEQITQSWPTQEQFDQAENHGIEYAHQEIADGAVGPSQSPLSGEWAGGLVPRDIAYNVAYSPSDGPAQQGVDELADAWEVGYDSTWQTHLDNLAPAQSVTDVWNSNKEQTS